MTGKATRPAARPRTKNARRKIAVMIVDDHPMWRDTLRDVLDRSSAAKVVAETSDGTDVVAVAKKCDPDVVVMDMGLPTVTGGAATRALLRALPDLKILVLSASDERRDVLDAVDSGAAGYLLKTASPEEVVDAVREVKAGQTVFPSALSSVVLDELRRRSTTPTSTERLRVVVADRSVLVREGVARILAGAGHEVVSSVTNSRDLLDACDPAPDVVILDEELPRVKEGDAQVHPAVILRHRNPHTGIIVLSTRLDGPVAVALLEGGSHGVGYLLKDRIDDPQQMADVVRRVARGDPAVDPEVVRQLVESGMRDNPLGQLSRRELEVLSLMAEGRSNQAIREHLHLTAKTVETHVRSIFTKLGLEPAADEHRRVKAVLTYLRSV